MRSKVSYHLSCIVQIWPVDAVQPFGGYDDMENTGKRSVGASGDASEGFRWNYGVGVLIGMDSQVERYDICGKAKKKKTYYILSPD